MPEQITEAVQLAEAENLGGGKYRVLVISAGTGSSGEYPASTLREAATKRLVQRGTQSFWDHPSATEAQDRPERSVRDLAGVFTSDAVWDEALQGLVADYQVFSPYRPLFAEMAEHVGMSIRGDGEIEMIEGKRVITALEHISSVDVVTRAGRGGKVLALLESARPGFDASDMAATTGVPHDATQDVPVNPAGGSTNTTQESQEDTMPQIEEAQLRQLEEAASRVPTLESERDAARQQLTESNARIALFEAQATARPVIAAKVAESKTLGARTQARLVESLVGNLPMTDGKVDDTALTAAIEAAVTAAEAEIADYAPTAPKSLFGSFGSVAESAAGASTDISESDIDAGVGSAFGRTPKGN